MRSQPMRAGQSTSGAMMRPTTRLVKRPSDRNPAISTIGDLQAMALDAAAPQGWGHPEQATLRVKKIMECPLKTIQFSRMLWTELARCVNG